MGVSEKISRKIHDEALEVKDKEKVNYDKKTWFSMLIEKGLRQWLLEKRARENEGKRRYDL